MAPKQVAVIGSGLSAAAACMALVERGIRPTILDVGQVVEPRRADVATRMAGQAPRDWDAGDLSVISQNESVKSGDFPRKLLFGSGYFYGRPDSIDLDCCGSGCPPFSHAKGGFSAGWGAAALRPDDSDLNDWPVGNAELGPFYAKVLDATPYSARKDGLHERFPIIKEDCTALRLSNSDQALLEKMERSGVHDGETAVLGQSRLLVQSAPGEETACRYCGHCMSGCVYGSIFKASDVIDRLRAADQIVYKDGYLVRSVAETNGGITIRALHAGKQKELVFDHVLIAAGAVNSTKIVLSSKEIFDQTVDLKFTVGFVAPMIKLGYQALDWPDSNTLASIFLEYKVPELSNHWVHAQVSTPNEMVLQRLGIQNVKSLSNLVQGAIAGRLVVANCNLHSNQSASYEMKLTRQQTKDVLHSSRAEPTVARHAIRQATKELSRLARRFGCYVVTPFVLPALDEGYHLGGTLPMRENPEREVETDLMGRPFGWANIHVIDTSVFPSLPGTTVGLLAMANAWRIAASMEL